MKFQIRLVLPLAYGLILHVNAEDQWALFKSEGRFSVSYPSDWYSAQPEGVRLEIFNFSAAGHVQGAILPSDGARITVGRQPEGVTTIEQWMRNDLVGSAKEAERDLKPNEAPPNCTKLTEVRWRWEVGPDEYFHETAYFCLAKAGIYRVQLTYRAGNPRVSELGAIALRVVSSLKTW